MSAVTGRRRILRWLVLAAACAAPVATATLPAVAVQTSTFSLTPTGERTSIVLYAGHGRVTDHFVLHNLTRKPITIDVRVLSLTKSGNTFQPGPPGVGFAQNVSLSTQTVPLGNRATRVLPVHVDTDYPGQGEHFAVIDAAQEQAYHPGINVVDHLQLAIELKPAALAQVDGSSATSTDVLLGIAAALILAALVAFALTMRRRRAAQG